jgi:integration host factor subunit beta
MNNQINPAVLNCINNILAKKGRIELRGFGVFEVFVRQPRKYKNIKTGETMYVPKSFRVKFKPSKMLTKRIIETHQNPIK